LGPQYVPYGTQTNKVDYIFTGSNTHFLSLLLLGFGIINSEQVASMHSQGTKDDKLKMNKCRYDTSAGYKEYYKDAESDGTKIQTTD
jgi:hypothetical protein